MLPHIILVLLVVCIVGICVFCPYSFVVFCVSILLLWAPLQAAYNNLIDTIPVISCVKCLSWTDSIWALAEKRRSFKGRLMGKKKESRGKQQKGFSSKRSSRTESHDDPAGSSVISLDDDSPSGEPAPVLSRSSSGGDLRLGDSSVPSQRSHGTPGSKADSGSRTTHRSTPTRSHPGDLDGKYGVQASAKDFEATPFGPNPPPGDPTLSTLSQDRSSRSGSKRPVDRPSSDRSDRSTRKGSTGDRSHRSLVTGHTGHRVLVTPVNGLTGSSGQTGQTGYYDHTGSTGHSGSYGNTGHTGQKALEAQDTQFLDRSELIVQNSPVRPVQLEHNVHESSDLLNSDSLDDRADESPEQAILRHARHQAPAIGHSVTGHTGNTGTGHTGLTSTGSTGHTGQHRSDPEHSVHRTHSVRSDAVDHGSTLLNRTLQQHRLELEYRSAADRTRHRSRSSRKDSGTHRAAISLRHADPGELSPAKMLRHRRVRSHSRSHDSVSPRRHSRSPSRSRGKKKKSHKKRKHSSTSSSSRRRSSFSSSRERSKHRHKSKRKKKHTSSRSSKRHKHVKKHKRKRSTSPSSSSSSVSSYSSSSRQRSPARKRSRSRSRSSSSAEESSHVPAPRAVSPVLPRDNISIYADDDDQFNSHSEDHQDLAPDTEFHSNASDIHSNLSSEDMKFQNLIEEVFKLLPADRFPKKTDNVLGGNKPRSSIEMELMKAPRKSISLPQSKGPLSKTIDCIKQSIGSVEQADGSYSMPSTIIKDWLPSKSDINKLVKLKYYQAHEDLIPTATASALDPDANRLDLSLSGSYPVKVSSLQSLEGQSRDMIRILSHAEIFSFAAFKSLQSENMDSKVLLEILKSMSMAVTDAMSLATAQTLGLQQMRREAASEAAIESAPKGSLT